MKKNLFLFPALVLTAFLCFITAACSSGYEAKGEVSFTFTEPMLRQIVSRAVGDSYYEDQDDYTDSGYGFSSYGQQTLYAQFYGFTELTADADYYTLNVFEDNTYAVYSMNMLEEVTKKYSFLSNTGDNKDDYSAALELLNDADFMELRKNPQAIYDSATISKGSWSNSNGKISIKEEKYYDSTSQKLVDVSNPTVIAEISEDASTFTVTSKAGYTITFYTNPDDIDYEGFDFPHGKDEPYGQDEPNGHDEPEAEVSKIPEVTVELTAGSKTYESSFKIKQVLFDGKKVDFETIELNEENFKKIKFLPFTVTFSNLKVGARAKVTAKVTLGKDTLASGESDSFKVEESTSVNMKMKLSSASSNQGGNDDPVHVRYPINFTISGFPEGASINASGSNTLKARMDLYMVNTSSPAASIIQEFIQANSEKVSDETCLKLFDATSTESSETSIGNATNLGTWGTNYNPVTISNGKFTDATSVGSYSFVGASEKKAYIFATILLDDGYYYLALPSAAQEFNTSGNNISLTLKKWKIPYELTVMLGEFDAEYPSEETSDYKAGDSVRFTLDNINNEKEVVADKLADVKEKLSKNGYSYNQYLSGYEYWGATYSSIAYFYKLKKASGGGDENQGSEEENQGVEEENYTEFGGGVSLNNDALIIEIDKTVFTPSDRGATLTAKTQDGKDVTEDVSFEYEVLRKGESIVKITCRNNSFNMDVASIQAGQYQLYVKAYKKMKNDTDDLYSSRYFTITISK